ncbi:MAG: glutamyl-tRNA reductase [Candidatus Melainabacteria bacterium]
MPLLVTGVRHKMASIEVRERFALLESEIEPAGQHLRALPGIEECAFLTTCNRSEIYAHVSDTETALASIREFYRQFKQVDSHAYRPHLFTLLDDDVVTYLFRVASGLDSLILGEGQILGQVKDMLATAHRLHTSGPLLDKLFKSALTVGKRVRTETGIAQKDVSVSRSAFELAHQLFPDLMDRRIALVGGGKMVAILLSAIQNQMAPRQYDNVTIVNRSQHRLETLTARYGFKGCLFSDLDAVLDDAEILFVATGAPHVILGEKHFAGRADKLVIDISVPRNVDPTVADLPNVRLFNTDSLANVNTLPQDTQSLLTEQAEDIIHEEYRHFMEWQHARPIVPLISQLRSKLEHLRREELSEQFGALLTEDPALQLADNLSKNLLKKILHAPTIRMKTRLARQQLHAAALAELFDLDPLSGPQRS